MSNGLPSGGGPYVPAPAAGLGSNSNYFVNSNCTPLTNVTVAITVTADMVANNGFGFQLNAYSPSGAYSAWQQYVIYLNPNSTQLSAAIDNWPMTGNNIINAQPALVNLPDAKLPAGYRLMISLANDAGGNIIGATYLVLDNAGNTVANLTETLTALTLASGGPVTSADLAPIIAYQLNLVGPYNSESATFSSGAGTITYSAAVAMTILSSEPPCAESGYITAETANSFYGVLPASPSQTFTQSFQTTTQTPMIRKTGKVRRSTRRR